MLYNQGYVTKDVSVQLQNCNVTISGEVSKSIQLPPHKTQHAELPFKTGITDGVFSCTCKVVISQVDIVDSLLIMKYLIMGIT